MLSFSRRSGGSATLSVSRAEILSFVRWLQDLEAAHQGLVYGHHSSGVIEFSAIVWRTEQSDQLATLEKLVTIFDDLMRATDQVDIVFLVELAYNILTERETHATVVVSVLLDTTLRVGPEQVAKEASIRNISWSHNVLDLLEFFEFGTESAMHAENLLVDDSCNWQTVEHICEHLPESNGVSAFALVVESVNAIDLGALVVAP